VGTATTAQAGTTALLNPPRAGVCEAVLAMSALAGRVVYVSCNPSTLLRDLIVLRETHRVVATALFDQFPYSDHAEVGVSLEAK
jgi:tRNA (uracil-5-)-methyltransferase